MTLLSFLETWSVSQWTNDRNLSWPYKANISKNQEIGDEWRRESERGPLNEPASPLHSRYALIIKKSRERYILRN